MNDRTAPPERIDLIRTYAGREGLELVDYLERPDRPAELLLLKPSEASVFQDLAGGTLADSGDEVRRLVVRAALADLGRLRRRRLETILDEPAPTPPEPATLDELRLELRRDLVGVIRPAGGVDLENLGDEDQRHYAATVRDLVEAYVRLGGDLELPPLEPTARIVAGTGVALYDREEVWQAIATLPELEDATTLADRVIDALKHHAEETDGGDR